MAGGDLRVKRHSECVQIIDEVMHNLGIKYSFFAGTALGLRREGKCLPYDPDIDFVIDKEHRTNVNDIIREFGKYDVKVISESRHGDRLECVGMQFGNDVDWIELDFLHTRGDKVWHPAIVSEGIINYVLPKRMWDNLEYIRAYGVDCPVFSPIDEFLEMMYGKDWRIPNPQYYAVQLFRDTPARFNNNWDLTED